MNAEILMDAIGQLPDELLEPVAALRRRKRVIRWVSLAACACLVIGLGLLTYPGFRTADNKLHAPEEMGMSDLPNCGGTLHSAQTPQNYFTATVIEVYDEYLIVCPMEDQWEALSSDRIHAAIPEDCRLDFQVGDTVKILYSGELLEVYPAIAHNVYVITIIDQ